LEVVRSHCNDRKFSIVARLLQEFLVVTRLVIEILFWSPFVMGANMNVNKHFPTFVMIHATNMSDAKWPCHINFDNPKSNDLVNLSNLGSTLL
jgi:hypothetical protein